MTQSVVFPICGFKDRWLGKGRKGLRSNPFSALLNPEQIKQSPVLVCFPLTTTLSSGLQGNGKASPALEMRRCWACGKGVYNHLSHAPPTLRLLYILLYQICLALQRKAPIPSPLHREPFAFPPPRVPLRASGTEADVTQGPCPSNPSQIREMKAIKTSHVNCCQRV